MLDTTAEFIDQSWLDQVSPKADNASWNSIPGNYRIFLQNDDFTPMEFAVSLICETLGLDYKQAVSIVLRTHFDGKAVCGEFAELKLAEQYVKTMIALAQQAGYPLHFYAEQII